MPTETLTPADARKLAEESEAIAKAATEGPWEYDAGEIAVVASDPTHRLYIVVAFEPDDGFLVEEDGVFCADARTRVPLLAAALSSLADQLDGANAENAAMREAAAYAMDGMEEARSKKELAAHLAITCLANAEYEAMPGGKTFRKRAAASTTKASPQ